MYPRTLNVKLTLHAGRESPAIVGISAPHSLVCGLPRSRPQAGSNLTLLSGEKGKENISHRKQPASLWRGMVEVSPTFYTIHYYVWCVTDPLPLWFSRRSGRMLPRWYQSSPQAPRGWRRWRKLYKLTVVYGQLPRRSQFTHAAGLQPTDYSSKAGVVIQ